MSRGIKRLSEQQCLAFAGRQQAGQHFHGGGLSAAIRPDEPEYLASLDRKIDLVDRGEIAETASEIARDDDGVSIDDSPRRYLQCLMPASRMLPEVTR